MEAVGVNDAAGCREREETDLELFHQNPECVPCGLGRVERAGFLSNAADHAGGRPVDEQYPDARSGRHHRQGDRAGAGQYL